MILQSEFKDYASLGGPEIGLLDTSCEKQGEKSKV